MCSQRSRLHPNRFTFGRVTAKRVNSVFCPVAYFHNSPEAMLRFGRIISIYQALIRRWEIANVKLFTSYRIRPTAHWFKAVNQKYLFIGLLLVDIVDRWLPHWPDDDVVRLNEFFQLIWTSVHLQQDGVRVRKPICQVVHLGLDVRR